MPPPKRRRLARHITLLVCAALMLVVNYVLSYGAMNWWLAREIVAGTSTTAQDTFNVVEPAYRPLQVYMASDRPGTRLLATYVTWCQLDGADMGITWSECRAEIDIMFDDMP